MCTRGLCSQPLQQTGGFIHSLCLIWWADALVLGVLCPFSTGDSHLRGPPALNVASVGLVGVSRESCLYSCIAVCIDTHERPLYSCIAVCIAVCIASTKKLPFSLDLHETRRKHVFGGICKDLFFTVCICLYSCLYSCTAVCIAVCIGFGQKLVFL